MRNVNDLSSECFNTFVKWTRGSFIDSLEDIDGCNNLMFHSRVCHNQDPNFYLAIPFHLEISPEKTTETRVERISMFNFPNAKISVPAELLPSIAHHKFLHGQVHSLIPEFHTYASITFYLRIAELEHVDTSGSVS